MPIFPEKIFGRCPLGFNHAPSGVSIGGNLISNGDFEIWPGTHGSQPTGWYERGNYAPGNCVKADIDNVYPLRNGNYSCGVYQYQHNLGTAQLYQQNADYADYVGQTITFSAYVNTTYRDIARIGITDGIKTNWSRFYPGGDTWIELSTSLIVSGNATKLEFILETGEPSYKTAPSQVAYFDDCVSYVSGYPTTEYTDDDKEEIPLYWSSYHQKYICAMHMRRVKDIIVDDKLHHQQKELEKKLQGMGIRHS